MARFYLTIVQAVLLYGADTWRVTSRDLTKLQSFHHRAARYMTGQHIRKTSETSWTYPNSEELLQKCRIFPIEVYLKRRRGTLRKYFDKYREVLLQKAMECKKHSKGVNKILWWNQEYIKKSGITQMSHFI